MLLLYFTTAVACWGLASAQSPASGFQCESAGYHPDPANCAVFYRCVSFWSGRQLRPVMFRCKEPTVFDAALRVCQFPWRLSPPCVKNTAGVWVRETATALVLPSVDVLPNITLVELGSADYVTSAPPTYQVAADSPFACPGPGEYFANIADSCVFYYQCVELQPGLLNATLYRCRPGEIFTETTGVCLRPSPLPACGQSSTQAADDLVAAAVEDDVYDDADFYFGIEF